MAPPSTISDCTLLLYRYCMICFNTSSLPLEIQALETRMMAVDDQSQRILAAPISYVELATVTLIGNSTYQDSIVLGTKLVRKHLGKRRRNRHTLIVIIQKAIHRLRPFQDNVWSLMGIESDESLVQFEAFRLQNTHRYFDARLANLLDATPCTLAKGSTQPQTHLFTPFLTIRSAQGGVLP